MITNLWVDGSGTTGGPIGCGIVLEQGPWKIFASYYPGVGTNNVAELKAILVGLRMLKPKVDLIRMLKPGVDVPPTHWYENKPEDVEVTLFSDSQYALYSTTGKFNGPEHRVLIARCQVELRNWPNFTSHWVKGHAGLDDNERADRLAAEARAFGLKHNCKKQGYVRFDVFRHGALCMSLDQPEGPKEKEGRWCLNIPSLKN